MKREKDNIRRWILKEFGRKKLYELIVRRPRKEVRRKREELKNKYETKLRK